MSQTDSSGMSRRLVFPRRLQHSQPCVRCKVVQLVEIHAFFLSMQHDRDCICGQGLQLAVSEVRDAGLPDGVDEKMTRCNASYTCIGESSQSEWIV